MGKISNYFFDAYAFFELIDGNKNYEKYGKGAGIVTTKMNLMELHYGLLQSRGKQIADAYYYRFMEYCIDTNDDSIIKANEFRLSNKGRGMSYVDCLGYIVAKENNIKFLTGDMAFQNIENVEFVK